MKRSVLIVAGEKSGENYGGAVVSRFREIDPECRFFGIGGRTMAAEGVEILQPMENLAVIGLVEIIKDIVRIGRILAGLGREAARRQPAAALLIDSPDFNLRLAKRLSRIGVPVLYYISPTVWAWRRNRLRAVKKYVRHMCLIFPFEQKIYDGAGIPAAFVGHPLVERVRTAFGREEFLVKHGFDRGAKLISLLPGSRLSEVRSHLPVLKEALKKIRETGLIQCALIQADGIPLEALTPVMHDGGLQLKILREDAYEAMAASDIVLSACGTANLEAALLGTPFVAFYRISPLTYWAGVNFVKIRAYSIVNILAGELVVPELIQRDFTADRLAAETRRILESEKVREQMKERFKEIRARLGEEQASKNVALELARLMGS